MKKFSLKNIFRTISMLVIISVIISALPCTATEAKSSKNPITIGHRGYYGMYPENTLQAFRGAMKRGFKGIECDLWENKKGEMLIHHDATLDKMTGKSGKIWNLKLSKRKNYPIISGTNIDKYKKNSVLIPSLNQTLKVMSKSKGYLILHLKSKSGYKMSSNGVKKIIKLIKRYKMTKKTIIMGSKKTIRRFIKSGIKVTLIITSQNANELKSEVKWCKKKGVKLICAMNMKQITMLGSEEKFARYCKKHGLKFGMYSTPDSNAYKLLTKLGATFAMSNNYVA